MPKRIIKETTTTVTRHIEDDEPAHRTLITFILDESGSMEMVKNAAIEGYNNFIKEQQKTDDAIGETLFTLLKFSSLGFYHTGHLWGQDGLGAYRFVCNGVPIEKAPLLNSETYTPRGGTPLFDAVAGGIRHTDGLLRPGDRALVVIQTDGEENESREYRTSDAIQQLIGSRMNQGNWTFAYLSSDPKGWGTASSIGVPVGNFMAYAQSAGGTYSVMANVSSSTANYRVRPAQSSQDFFVPAEEEKGKPLE